MLSNDITIAVDTENTGVTADLTYKRYDEYQNRTIYISENHDPGARDLLGIYRTFPKPVGVFKGVRKTSVKFTKDFTVGTSDGGETQSPGIIEINFSFPVGLLPAQTVELRQRAIALLDLDVVMAELNDLQVI